jgi:dihydroneopterin aldolase
MTIIIEDLTFQTILGILEHERINRQEIRIDCIIDYPYSQGNFINYADIAVHIETTMEREQFELIETALEVISVSLKAAFPLISTLSLTIRKPNILQNCIVGVQNHFIF